MSSDSSSDKSLRTFVPLCFATFFLFASYDNGMHATSGYVYETFWEQRFPNRSDSNSTDESHCTTNKSSEAYRDGQLVQKQVARWSVYVSLAHGVPLILSSVLFSSLSDTFPVHRSVWYMYQAVPDNFGNVFAMERLPFFPHLL